MDNTIQTNSNSDEHIYITTSDTFTPFPDSILRETVHKYLDSFLTEREDKDMAKLQYTDVWGHEVVTYFKDFGWERLNDVIAWMYLPEPPELPKEE